MITTAVQQASQMVEIQGAPSTVAGDSDEFRVAFAASVSGTAAASAGLSSAKETLAGALLAKNATVATSGVSQSPLRLKGAGPDEDVPELETETVSASSLKSSSDPAVKNITTADVDTDASIADVDARSTPLTRVSDESPVKILRSASANARVSVSESRPAESAAVQKGDGLSKLLDGAAVARGRKNEASIASKGQGYVGAQAIGPGTPVADNLPTSAAVIVSDQAKLNSSVALQAPQAGVLDSLIQGSDGTKTVFGSPIRPVETGELVSTSTGSSEVASLQRDTFEIPSAPTGVKGTGDVTPIANRDNPVSGADGPTARSASKGAPITSVASQASGEGASATAEALAGLGAATPAALDFTVRQLSRATLTQSASGSNNTAVKTNVSAEGPANTAVSQAGAIAPPHSGWRDHSFSASQAFALEVVGSAQDLPASFEGKESGSGPQPTSTSGTQTNSVAAVSQDGAKISQQPEVVRDATPVTASPRVEPLKVSASPGKDDKAKTSVDGSEDSAGTRTTAVSSTLGDTPSVSSSNPLALAGGAAGRVITAADAAIPVSQTTPHITGTSAHGVAAATVSAGAVRAQGAVSAGALTDPTSSSPLVAESHRTLVATPTTLEVGVQSGTQGWLRIRAEVGDQGAVNASLTAGSSGGTQLLHSQMPALNAFLHSEQIAVTPTVVERGTPSVIDQGFASPGSDGLGSHDGSGASHGSLTQGGGAQSDGDRRDSSERAVSLSASETVRSYDVLSSVNGTQGSHSGWGTTSGESGRWLNVRV